MIRGGLSRKEGYDPSVPPTPARLFTFLRGLWEYVHREVPDRRELDRAVAPLRDQVLAAEVFGRRSEAPAPPDPLHATLLAPPRQPVLRPDDAQILLASQVFR